MSANPFGGLGRKRAAPSSLEIGPAWLAPLVLIGCLVLSAGVIAWRATDRTTKARAHARSEAVAIRRALENQFGQALASAEVLGVLARQGHGAVPTFHETARELLVNHPGVATLELQPSGVVTAIAPWAGNEQAIGCNTFRDGLHRLGAQQAMQRRCTTLAGPLRLYHGEPGMIAYSPVYFTGPDGREAFWGFAAASLKLQDALARSGVNELPGKGYQFSFFALGSGGREPIVLAGRNPVSPDALREAVRFQNVEFRLALEPRGGWIDRTELGLDVAVALLSSGLAALVLVLWSKRAELEAASASLSERLAHEADDRKQAQNEFQFEKERSVAVQAELDRLRAARLQAETNLAEAQARFQAAERSAAEAAETERERLRQTEARVGELELQLDAAARSAREAVQEHRKELTAALTKVEQFEAAEQVGQSRLAEAQARIASLDAQLAEATRKAAAAKAAAEAAASAAITAAAAPESEPGSLEKPEAYPSRTAAPQPAPGQKPQSLAAPTSSGPAPDIAPPALAGSGSSFEPPITPAPTHEVKKRSQRTMPSSAPDSQIVLPFLDAPLPKAVGSANLSAPAASVTSGSPPTLSSPPSSVSRSERDKSTAMAEPSTSAAPLDVGDLRQATHEIVPLLGDQDPGAEDCLQARSETFRAAFANEAAYGEFADAVRRGDFRAALDHLRRAAKRHGVTV